MVQTGDPTGIALGFDFQSFLLEKFTIPGLDVMIKWFKNVLQVQVKEERAYGVASSKMSSVST